MMSVTETNRKSQSLLAKVFGGTLSLLRGMGVTWHYLVRPKTVITQQYPENRETLQMFERFRGRLGMVHDEQGFNKCTACQICENACPNYSLQVLFRESPTLKKTELEALLWRMDSCTYCNACVMSCPHDVLTFNNKFESAVYDRRTFVFNMAQYAGAPASALMKVEDPAERAKMVEPRGPYVGPVPLCGTALPGVKALGEPPAKAEPKKEDNEPKA